MTEEWLVASPYRLQIRYDFLHRGIIERFIVQVGQHVEQKHPSIWRSGIAIHHQASDTRALVDANLEKKTIVAQAKGKEPVAMLCRIQNWFAETYDGFKPSFSFSTDGGKHFVLKENIEMFTRCEAKYAPTIDDGPLIDLASLQNFLQYSDEQLPEAPMQGGSRLESLPEKHRSRSFCGRSSRTKIFVCYSRKDKKWLDRLEVHLRPMEVTDQITLWHDGIIRVGTHWEDEIRSAIESSVMAVLLISADFLAADYINDVELPLLLTVAKKREIHLLQIIVSPCNLKNYGL